MRYQIRKAAVLGAGVMGAAFAAHLANVGISSLLLDIVPPNAGKDRNVVARTGLEKALKARPAAFYSPKSAIFRTGDLSGLDTLAHVADNLYENAPGDPQRETFRLPDVVREMIRLGWLGEKSGQGLLQAHQESWRRIYYPGTQPRDAGIPAAAEGALPLAGGGARHPRPCAAHTDRAGW